ncbi:MAG: alpha/beta fold hydrolase [Chitinivibrionales bacterium]|nr:alpha/beta fold hydrolase [Chitinivibrionales bacterium]MBD3394410.1 alpha/beta fold hydrolase [Chitinivibrionales bacterium]
MHIVTAVLAVAVAAAAIVFVAIDREKRTLNEDIRAAKGGTYLTLAHGVTHYELAGPETGEIVVLVHGGTIPLWAWDEQVQPLINAGCRVLRYDQYGRGLSDRPAVRYDRELYRNQLLELLDRLRFSRPVHLIGHSFGGTIAAHFAAKHPDRIARLILVAPFFDLLKYDTPYRAACRLVRTPLAGRLFVRFVLIPKSITRARQLLGGNESGNDIRRFEEQLLYCGFEYSLRSLLRHDFVENYREEFDAIARAKYPVSLVWGNKDNNVPRALVNDVRSWVPRAKYVELEGVGHQPGREAADRFNQCLLELLGD